MNSREPSPERLATSRELSTIAELLDQLSALVGRAVDATADNLEEVRAEQAELRDEVLTLSRRLESLTRLVSARLAEGS